MGFSGRCEAMRAPTTENDTAMMAMWAIGGPPRARKISSRVLPLRRVRIRLAAASATLIRHSDPASHAVTRALILATPRSCTLAPSVTTLLYSTTVSQALRKASRGSLYEARRERTSENAQKAKFAEYLFHALR